MYSIPAYASGTYDWNSIPGSQLPLDLEGIKLDPLNGEPTTTPNLSSNLRLPSIACVFPNSSVQSIDSNIFAGHSLAGTGLQYEDARPIDNTNYNQLCSDLCENFDRRPAVVHQLTRLQLEDTLQSSAASLRATDNRSRRGGQKKIKTLKYHDTSKQGHLYAEGQSSPVENYKEKIQQKMNGSNLFQENDVFQEIPDNARISNNQDFDSPSSAFESWRVNSLLDDEITSYNLEYFNLDSRNVQTQVVRTHGRTLVNDPNSMSDANVYLDTNHPHGQQTSLWAESLFQAGNESASYSRCEYEVGCDEGELIGSLQDTNELVSHHDAYSQNSSGFQTSFHSPYGETSYGYACTSSMGENAYDSVGSSQYEGKSFGSPEDFHRECSTGSGSNQDSSQSLRSPAPGPSSGAVNKTSKNRNKTNQKQDRLPYSVYNKFTPEEKEQRTKKLNQKHTKRYTQRKKEERQRLENELSEEQQRHLSLTEREQALTSSISACDEAMKRLWKNKHGDQRRE